MNVIEIVLIAVGISLDIFGYTVCQSASYAKLDRKKLGFYSSSFAIWEFFSLVLGYFSVELLIHTQITDSGSQELNLLAVIILLIMAIRMFLVGLRKETIIERRKDDVRLLSIMHNFFFIGLRTYLVGFAFAACETCFGMELLILMIIGILTVLLGLYIGYRYGFEIRNKTYFMGAILLLGMDIIIFLKFIVNN